MKTMTTEDVQRVGKMLLLVHGLQDKGWTIKLNSKKNIAGECSYEKKTIYISRHVIPLNSEKVICNLILHEIAHALMPESNHDVAWKRVFISIGGDGEEKFKGKMPEGKYKYVCPTCNKVASWHKELKRNMFCLPCSKVLGQIDKTKLRRK